MQINDNFSLKPLNTFAIDAAARYFIAFGSVEELEEAFDFRPGTPVMILGGGSNILLTEDYPGLVLKNDIGEIEIVHEDTEYVYVRAGAGINWQSFVQFCIDRDLGGVENLSLIPGSCGASPMQNIGAYGVEVRNVFHELEAFHIKDRRVITFSNNDCAFGYRESVFKNKLKGQFVIVNVTYRLHKFPRFNTSYGAIGQELEHMNTAPSVKAISQAVINIRTAKLPDPKRIGNAGSFFKNPVVSSAEYQQLKSQYPQMPAYPQLRGAVKLAAGWLIEQCGWKGYRQGDAGCHAQQALVLVNYGKATGHEILELSEKIRQSVESKFGVHLEREVNII